MYLRTTTSLRFVLSTLKKKKAPLPTPLLKWIFKKQKKFNIKKNNWKL